MGHLPLLLLWHGSLLGSKGSKGATCTGGSVAVVWNMYVRLDLKGDAYPSK
jgi:hypothetical protein